jgi:hypothetical protein
VGVAGFLLGAGFSFLSRSYGLGSDNVESLTLVTPDAKIRTLTRSSSDTLEQDLFWACSGGGGGNFGVAIEVEIQTHRPPNETMLMGEVVFPFYRIDELLPWYNTWVESLPPSLAVYGRIAMAPDPRSAGTRILSLLFTPVFNGDFAEGVRALDPLLRKGPIRAELHRMTIHEWEDLIGGRTTIAGRSAYIRSLVLPPRGWTDAAVKVLKKYFAVSPSPDTFMVWTHTGGKIEEQDANASAFPHRNCRFVPEVKAIWETARPEEMRKNVEWAYDFFEELDIATGATGAYVNYIDPLLSNWKQKYYGGHTKRLERIRERIDPDNFFHFQQSIGSAFDTPADKREPTQPGGPKKPLDLSPLRETFFFDTSRRKPPE